MIPYLSDRAPVMIDASLYTHNLEFYSILFINFILFFWILFKIDKNSEQWVKLNRIQENQVMRA